LSFCQRILGEAIETDRRLKGSGFPNPGYKSPHAARVSFSGEIEARKQSIIAFYHREHHQRQSLSFQAEKFVERNKGKLQITASIVGVVGLIITAFKFFAR
jgi:hypothetical protein